MTAAHIYDILDEVRRPYTREYEERYLHRVPDFECVDDRVKWLAEKAKGRNVLDVGCGSGELHAAIGSSAALCVGIDSRPCDSPTAAVYDIDDPWEQRPLPFADLPIDLIVCGEVIEHLGNPRQALERLLSQWPDAELIVTVPNAFCSAGAMHMVRGRENVNDDHVAWYSWHTMTVLLRKSGWRVKEVRWYNGKPRIAEGLIFTAGAING